MTKTIASPRGSPALRQGTECMADILQRELDATIQEWVGLVEKEPELSRIRLNFQERTGHLPRLLHDVLPDCALTKDQKLPSRSLQAITESYDENRGTPLPWS